METCLVFPRLICKSQWGVGVPAFSGHRFKKSIYTKMPICKFSRGRICVAKNNGEQRENKRARGTCVSAEISGAARNLTGSPQPIWEMGAVSKLVLWVGPVL